jgi:hypothetical protein
LRPGDLLRSADGQRVAVEAVSDLGEESVVYNLRVSRYHTYFVGDRDWPFSLWAHNEYHTRSGARRVRAQARKASQPHQLSLFPELEKGNTTTDGATQVGAAINREPVSTTGTGGAQETDRASGVTGDTAPAAIPRRIPNPNAPRPVIKTSLPDRVTKELPEGETRTPEEVKQARNFLNAIGKRRGGGGKNEKEETGQKMPHMMSIQDPSRTEVILCLLSRALMGRHGRIWKQVIFAVGGKWGEGLVSNYLPHEGKVKSRTEKWERRLSHV